jgi:hypothetical protein
LKSDRAVEIISIAVAFHDIGIWTNKTFDYINPSIELVKKYASENDLDSDKIDEIVLIIREHHKLTKITRSALAEQFRQSDLIDLTFGLIRNGRSKEDIQLIKKTFPNKGFHLYLVRLFLKNLFTNPGRPLPMYKL